jgi:hypothetical protein
MNCIESGSKGSPLCARGIRNRSDPESSSTTVFWPYSANGSPRCVSGCVPRPRPRPVSVAHIGARRSSRYPLMRHAKLRRRGKYPPSAMSPALKSYCRIWPALDKTVLFPSLDGRVRANTGSLIDVRAGRADDSAGHENAAVSQNGEIGRKSGGILCPCFSARPFAASSGQPELRS